LPDFDPSKLSHPERVARIERKKGDGSNEVSGLFATQLRAANMLRDERNSPAEIAALIMGDYYDADHLSIGGPVVRHQQIILLEAMVRQAVELVSEAPPPAAE
jgi:hypothetical protein